MLRARSPYFEGALSPFRRAAQIVSKSRDPSPNRSTSMPTGASPRQSSLSTNSTPHASPQTSRRTADAHAEAAERVAFPATPPPPHRRTESEQTPTRDTRPSPSRALSSSAVGRNLEVAFSTARSHHMPAPTARQPARLAAWSGHGVSSGASSSCGSESSGSSYSMDSHQGGSGVESYAGSRTNLPLAAPFAAEAHDAEAYQLKDCLDRLEMRSLASTDSLDIFALGFPAPPPTRPGQPTLREMRGLGVSAAHSPLESNTEAAPAEEEAYVAPSADLFAERRPSSLRERRAKEPISISLAQTKIRPSFSPALSVRSPPPCPPPTTPLPELPNTPRYTPRSTPRSSGRLASPPGSRPGSASSSGGSGSEEVLASSISSASERSFAQSHARSQRGRMRSATLSAATSEYGSDVGYESCRSSPMSPAAPLTPLDQAYFSSPAPSTVAMLRKTEGKRSVSIISKASSSDASSSCHSTLESIAHALNLDGFESPAYHDAPLPEEDGVTYGYAM